MISQRQLQILSSISTLLIGAALSSAQTTVTLGAVDDVTLYQETNGALANGAGRGIFVGRNGTGLIRRALLKFDIAPTIPSNAIIRSATLRLRQTRNNNGLHTVTLHRARASWGEGTSNAGGEEGGGVLAAPNDATWIHRFSPSMLWTRPGGDFDLQPIASTLVDSALINYDWVGPALAADVQAWLASSSSNFGWLLKGDESDSATAHRFDSHESGTATARPQLIITYTTPPPPPVCTADFDGDGLLTSDDLSSYITAFFNVPPLSGADFNASGGVDPDDLSDYIGAYFAGCP